VTTVTTGAKLGRWHDHNRHNHRVEGILRHYASLHMETDLRTGEVLTAVLLPPLPDSAYAIGMSATGMIRSASQSRSGAARSGAARSEAAFRTGHCPL
jgi:hypothetical protein